jgi:GNAT superfamily N-acetyltransferase
MLRRASLADIPRITEIRGAVRENRLSDPSRVTVADLHWHIAHSPIHVWEDGGIIKGFSAGDPRDGSIFALFVDPAFEGQGIGQALILAACRSLAAAGHRIATLSTDPGTRAERFYARNGWLAKGLDTKGEMVFERELASEV